MLIKQLFSHPFWSSGRVVQTWGNLVFLGLLWILMFAIPSLLVSTIVYYGVFMGDFVQVENYFANFITGGYPSIGQHFAIWGSGVILLVWYLITSFLYTAATWLVVRGEIQGQPVPAVETMFEKSWQYLGYIVWITVRMFCYLFIPIILVLIATVVLVAGGLEFGNSSPLFFNFNGWATAIATITIIVSGFWLLARAVMAGSWLPLVFLTEQSDRANAINNARLTARKYLGSLFLFFFGYFIIYLIISSPLIFVAESALYLLPETYLNVIEEGVDFLLQVFIFGPILVMSLICLADMMLRQEHSNTTEDVKETSTQEAAS